MQDQETFWQDRSHWSGGIYFCKEDPRFIIPKQPRWGGWTMNFGHRASTASLVVLILFCMALTGGIGYFLGDAKTGVADVQESPQPGWLDAQAGELDQGLESVLTDHIQATRKEHNDPAYGEDLDFTDVRYSVERQSPLITVDVKNNRSDPQTPVMPSHSRFQIDRKTLQVTHLPSR